jgi:adenylate cyclase
MERKLAAILAIDVVGYSRLMENNEADTFERLSAHRKELFEPEIEKHKGRIFKLMGDGLLVEFGSVVDAVECAAVLQRAMAARNEGLPPERRIDVRMGVNLGDVIIEGEDRHGEGINIAARLQQLAEPGGIWLSSQAYEQVETKLGLAFEDLGEHSVKNILKPVHVYRVRTDAAIPSPQARGRRPSRLGAVAAGLAAIAVIGGAGAWFWKSKDPTLAIPTGPSIAVLPFANPSSHPDDVYFGVGLTEDIIAALGRFSNLIVFARQSTGKFTGEMADPKTVRRELGADYILTGTVRRQSDQLRVTVALLDARNGTQRWAETYNRKLTAADIFAVQDEITEQVVGIIGSSDAPLFKKRKEELRAERPNSLEAYECVLLSLWLYDDFSEEAHGQARECLERTVKLTPDYALAWAHLGQIYFEEYKYNYNLRPEPIARARAATQRALELDPQEQYAHYILALMLYTCEPGFDAYYEEAERAIALNPNDAFVLADLGLWMVYSGKWERGVALVEKATILNPLHQDFYYFAFFLDHYRREEYQQALEVHQKMNQPKNQGIQAALAAVYGKLGDAEKAKAAHDLILQTWPKFAEDPLGWFVRRRFSGELIKELADGLRKAGFSVPVQSPTSSLPPAC